MKAGERPNLAGRRDWKMSQKKTNERIAEYLKHGPKMVRLTKLDFEELGCDAAYSKKFDHILYDPKDKTEINDFYILHEMAHSTGHSSRLNRPTLYNVEMYPFSFMYEFDHSLKNGENWSNWVTEELIAQLAAKELYKKKGGRLSDLPFKIRNCINGGHRINKILKDMTPEQKTELDQMVKAATNYILENLK
jgi:hypothetical protein